MLNKICLCCTFVVGLLAVDLSVVFAAKHTIQLKTTDLSAYTPEDATLGKYYTLNVEIPDLIEGKELYGAYIEMHLDVGAREVDGWLDETPRLEVFALKSEFVGTEDMSQLGTPAFGPTNVVRGENRKVRIDISEIVRSWMDDPLTNHGLILGSLSGSRLGLFVPKDDVVAENAVGTVVFHYRR